MHHWGASGLNPPVLVGYLMGVITRTLGHGNGNLALFLRGVTNYLRMEYMHICTNIQGVQEYTGCAHMQDLHECTGCS